MGLEPTDRSRAPAWGGLAGPVWFGAAWIVGGIVRSGYDAVEQPISRLAESGAPTRALMSSGMLALAAGLLATSRPLAREMGRPAGLALAGTALATAGVALTPLRGDVANAPHALFAAAGYATLAAAPLLATRSLATAGRRWWALVSAVAGLASAGLLAASGTGPAPGLLQRLGLTVGHTWVAVASVAVATGRGPVRARQP